MIYNLECEYDTRKSFYGKAVVENSQKLDYKLYSYGTLVARCTTIGDKKLYVYYGYFSQTTTRHQKEFFRQFGLTDDEIKKVFLDGKLEKEIDK